MGGTWCRAFATSVKSHALDYGMAHDTEYEFDLLEEPR